VKPRNDEDLDTSQHLIGKIDLKDELRRDRDVGLH
jgi:hypothetical protein